MDDAIYIKFCTETDCHVKIYNGKYNGTDNGTKTANRPPIKIQNHTF